MTKKFVFLEPDTSQERKRVSARIPISLHERFIEAQRRAKQNDLELSITHVVRTAMQSACEEVEKVCGAPDQVTPSRES